jgi:hypothetical protein
MPEEAPDAITSAVREVATNAHGERNWAGNIVMAIVE